MKNDGVKVEGPRTSTTTITPSAILSTGIEVDEEEKKMS